MCLRDWPQARNLEYLRKQYRDWQHAVVPCSYLLAIFCCFKSKFLCFQQNVPWPYKTLKSHVAQRNHENFEEVCSQLLVSQLAVQSLLLGTQGTGVSKGGALPRGPCRCQLLVRAVCPSKCPPKPSQHCSAVASPLLLLRASPRAVPRKDVPSLCRNQKRHCCLHVLLGLLGERRLDAVHPCNRKNG